MFSTNGVDNFKLARGKAINTLRGQYNEDKLAELSPFFVGDQFNHQGEMFFFEIELL